MTTSDKIRRESPFNSSRDFVDGARRRVGERRSVPKDAAKRLSFLASGMVGAPKQYEYKPLRPLEPSGVVAASKVKPRVAKVAKVKTVAPGKPHIAVQVKPAIIKAITHPKATQCFICFSEFPSRNAWGRHYSICGNLRYAEGAD